MTKTQFPPDITEAEARLLEAYGPLEMARVINSLLDTLDRVEQFATIRSQDDSKTFARVNRGALRNIAENAHIASAKIRGEQSPLSGDVK